MARSLPDRVERKAIRLLPVSAAGRISLVFIAAVALVGGYLLVFGLYVQWLRLRLYLAQGVGFADPACAVAYCDYSLFWLAGLLARHGTPEAIYRSGDFFAFGAHTLTDHTAALPFLYPPTMLLPAALMSLPPLAAGYYLFSLVSLIGGIILLRYGAVPWACIAAGLLSPAAMWSLYLGQFGLLANALLICGLARLESQPKRSGGLLAALCIKPQYTPLIPMIVLAGRNWRAIATGVLVLALLLAASVLCFGWQSWAAFLGPGREEAAKLLNAPFGPGYEELGSSVFWMLRSFGAGLDVTWLLQGGISVLAVLAAWYLWRRPAADADAATARLAMTVCLVLLTSPYGYTYDLTGYSIVLPLLARRDTPLRNAGLAALWLTPAFVLHFIRIFGFLPTPLFILAAFFIALPSSARYHEKCFT